MDDLDLVNFPDSSKFLDFRKDRVNDRLRVSHGQDPGQLPNGDAVPENLQRSVHPVGPVPCQVYDEGVNRRARQQD